MQRITSLSFLFFIASSLILVAQPNYSWVLNGNQAGDFAEITDLAVDANGNSYVLINYTEPISFGSVSIIPIGGNDLAVVKFNSEGVAQWGINAGSLSDDRGNALAVSTDGAVYVTGYITSDATFGFLPPVLDNISDLSTEYFVGKISSSGQWLWVRQQSSVSVSEGKDIAIDYDGSVVVGGSFYAADLNLDGEILTSGEQLPFVAKYANSGSIQWAFSPQTEWGASFTALAVGLSNEVIFCGSFGTAEVSSVDLIAGDVVLTNQGDADNSLVAADIYVLALNGEGVPVWGKNAGSVFIEAYTSDLTVGAGGEVYVSGFFQDSLSNYEGLEFEATGGLGDYDAFIASLSPFGGSWNWIQRLGTTDYDLGQTRLSSSVNGVVYLSVTGLQEVAYGLGATEFTPTPGETSLISRVNSDGSFLWAFSLLDLYAFSASTENQFRVAGKYTGTAQFGDTSLTATGGASGTDLYVGKIQFGPDLPNNVTQVERVDLSVFPNPFNEYFDLNATEKVVAIEVYDASGRMVLNQSNPLRVSMQNLDAGNYFVRVISSKGTSVIKAIKL